MISVLISATLRRRFLTTPGEVVRTVSMTSKTLVGNNMVEKVRHDSFVVSRRILVSSDYNFRPSGFFVPVNGNAVTATTSPGRLFTKKRARESKSSISSISIVSRNSSTRNRVLQWPREVAASHKVVSDLNITVRREYNETNERAY